MRILAAQLVGFLIHQLHEGIDGAGHGFGQNVGRFVGGYHHQAVQQVLHADLLAGHDTGGTAVLVKAGHGGGGCRYYLLHGQLPLAHRFQRQKGGHDLGQAGRIHLVVCVLIQQHQTAGFIHQQRRLGLDGDLRRTGRGDFRRIGGRGKGRHAQTRGAKHQAR